MMKKSLGKAFSLLLAVLIMVLSVAPGVFAAASYPEGVSKEDALSAIVKTDTVLNTLLKQTQNKSLKALILPEIYSSASLSALTVGIYTALEENGEDIAAVGIDLSVGGVAKRLGGYPEVAEALSAYGKWSEVSLDNVNWGVTDKAGFCYAAGAVLSPFNDLVYALLCGGSYSLNSLIGIKGAKGYETAIIPALKALGCESITDPEKFYADAEGDKNTMVASIVGDVMLLLERILDTPCDTLTDILPGIAVFLTQGGFDNAISTLIEPLRLQIFNISTIFKVQSILNFISDSESFTQNFTLNFNDIMGDTGLKLAEIDLEAIAACGTVSGDKVVSDKADTFMYLLRFLIDTLKLNGDSLSSAEELGADLSMFKGFLSKSTDEIIKMLFGILCAKGSKFNDYQWAFPQFTPVAGTYTPNLGADKYQRVVDGIDELFDEFIREGGEYDSLGAMLKQELYSNKLVSEVVCGVYGMLSSQDMAGLGGMLGLPTTPSTLANILKGNQFSYTKKVLYSSKSFDKVNTTWLTWGFENGDKEGFINALCGALEPMSEIINALLCEGKVQVMGCIDLYGSNGYNTAVIPLLEAFGCSADTIKTYDEYKALSAKGEGIRSILLSLTSLIDRVIERPVYTLLEMLPNLMYNMNGGLLKTVMANLMYPFNDILGSLGEGVLDLGELENFDIASLLGGMTEGGDMPFDLSKLDLKQLASYGTAVTAQSKRTSGGQFVNITYIKADMPAEIVTVLRYFVEMMKEPGNEDLIMGFMSSGGEEGGNDMFANFSGGITEELAGMTTDETVEWLYKLFFRERPVVQENIQSDYLPTIIYVNADEKDMGGAVVLSLLLLLAVGEVIYIKKKDKIKSYLEDRRLKKQLSAEEIKQEV